MLVGDEDKATLLLCTEIEFWARDEGLTDVLTKERVDRLAEILLRLSLEVIWLLIWDDEWHDDEDEDDVAQEDEEE